MMNLDYELQISGRPVKVLWIVVALPILALLYAGYAGFLSGDDSISARNDTITSEEQDLDKKRAERDDLARQAKDIVQIQQQNDDLKKSILLLKQQIPSEAQVPVLLFDLVRMVKDSQGTLNSFEPGKLRDFSGGGSATQGIQELPVTIHASATYPEVIKFLDSLNAYERKLSVSDLSLSPAGNAGVASSNSGNSAPVFQNTLNVEFTLLAYVLKEGGTSP